MATSPARMPPKSRPSSRHFDFRWGSYPTGMLKRVVGVLGLAFVIAPVAVAQQVIDTVLFEQGQQLYQDNCALCHKDSGAGDPPTFPALSGNDQLGDPVRIVSNIHQGTGNMPPLPDLTAEEISSLANYVRNAWANDARK